MFVRQIVVSVCSSNRHVFKMNNRYKFTLQERIFFVTSYLRTNADYDTMFTEFQQQFPNSPLPNRTTVWKTYQKFLRTGSVADAPRSGRPVSVTTNENMETVALALVEQPNQSAVRLSGELQISDRSLRRMLKRMHYRVYRPRLVHALHEDDFDRRLEFCEWYLGCSQDDRRFQHSILWSDEATFKLNGTVNRHNCVYWNDQNPHVFMEKELNLPGVCVWAGIHAGGLVGPYFFEGHVTGQSYLEMLEDLRGQMDNDPTLANIRHFMQDGAPPHYALCVREYLNFHFGEWIGRRGFIEWPARSCDLTPCDFFLWGLLKDRVFATGPRTLPDLRTAIEEEFETLRRQLEMLRRTCLSVEERCRKCIDQDGHQFEHLQ